jgi:hypothetical protein
MPEGLLAVSVHKATFASAASTGLLPLFSYPSQVLRSSI